MDEMTAASRRTDPDNVYERILAVLDDVPWAAVPHVERIYPRDRQNIDFFPGQRGFAGPTFPVGGIMMVGNNFCSRSGEGGLPSWLEAPDVPSAIKTWRRLRDFTIPSSGLSIERFWFTNYCHGAMDVRDKKGKIRESYRFRSTFVKTLCFDKVFERHVELMQPRLIVSLGSPARDWLKVVDRTTVGSEIIAITHPSAPCSDEQCKNDGRRIRAAYEAAVGGPGI